MDKSLEKLSGWKLMPQLTWRAMQVGDSGPRYKMIRASAGYLHKSEGLDAYLAKKPESLSHEEHVKAFRELGESWGVKGLEDDTLLTCGNCGLVCGASVEESVARYRLLTQSGLVYRAADGSFKGAETFEEAEKSRVLPKRTIDQQIKGALSMLWVFHKWYFGFEPKSFIQGIQYKRRLKQAVQENIKGHKLYAANIQQAAKAAD
jgi:hypothetical protein